ncbi:MAG: polyphosphate kinase 2 family protein [Pseudomonadales bacterium]
MKFESDADLRRFIRPYGVEDPEDFSLADHDPGDTHSLPKGFKADAKTLLAQSVEWMAEQQALLAAQDQWALLLIFQGRDAAGKDSTIRHVMTGLNPQGCHVTSFKRPHHEDLDHDFLWRYHRHIPARGDIGIFNRSHYEEVLIVRIHQQLLRAQKIPEQLVTEQIWEQRFEDINNFERYLSRNGVRIVKFYLNISKDEQKKRFLSRLEHPEKHWKFSEDDIAERRYWDEYSRVYQDMISHTATEQAPWYVVPADTKWYARLLVASVVVSTLQSMALGYPQVSRKTMKDFDRARKELESS